MKTVNYPKLYKPQIDFSIAQKSGDPLSNYTLHISGGNDYTFTNSYLVPKNQTIVFTPEIRYLGENNFLTQCRWTFGDGIKISYISPFDKVTYKEDWVSGHSYQTNNLVTVSGAPYICTDSISAADNTTSPVTNEDNWSKFGIVEHKYTMNPESYYSNVSSVNSCITVGLTAVDRYQRILQIQKIIYLID